MEKTIEFIIDGNPAGSSTLFFENGEMDTSLAEDRFWKAVRFSKDELIKEEREFIIDHLTAAQEDLLKEAHAEDYHGTDDDMPDAYEGWLMELSFDDLKAILTLK